jgi:hypothetical protein
MAPIPLETAESVLAACAVAKAMAPAAIPPTLPPDPSISFAPGWHSFERPAWEVGEQVRQAFNAYPKLKKVAELQEAVLDVATYRNLRRGRQSFVMALGFVGAAGHAPTLAPLLHDPDVDGQVVDCLLKMRAPGFASQVSILLSHNQAWVRRLAHRYIERYG